MALIKCPDCNHDLSDKAPACPHCGFPTNNIVPCPGCGVFIDKEVDNCPHCGYTVTTHIFAGVPTDTTSPACHSEERSDEESRHPLPPAPDLSGFDSRAKAYYQSLRASGFTDDTLADYKAMLVGLRKALRDSGQTSPTAEVQTAFLKSVRTNTNAGAMRAYLKHFMDNYTPVNKVPIIPVVKNSPDTKSASNARKQSGSRIAGIIILSAVILFAVIGLRGAGESTKSPVYTSPATTAKPSSSNSSTSKYYGSRDEEDIKISLYVMAEKAIEDTLLAPSTAKFINSWECVFKYDKDNDVYLLSGYVDAQNSFGAMLRKTWVASAEVDGKKLRMYYLVLDGELYEVNYSIELD